MSPAHHHHVNHHQTLPLPGGGGGGGRRPSLPYRPMGYHDEQLWCTSANLPSHPQRQQQANEKLNFGTFLKIKKYYYNLIK
jgi:hypothetical protein